MRLSIVSTLYRSAPFLAEFYRRATAAAARLTDDYELVLVNDGSPDESLAAADELARFDRRVTVIDLSRNFGHHAAMMTGLKHASGELVFLIDSDLEEAPELLERFDAIRREASADVVYGVQDVRRGGRLSNLGGTIFYRLFNALSDVPIPVNLMTVRLMTRRYVDALLEHTECEIVIAGLWARTGFHQVGTTVVKGVRPSSTYRLAQRVKMFVDTLCSFSNKPLYIVFYVGLAILATSTGAATWLVVRRLFFGVMLEGWPSLMVSLWMLAGLIIFCQGVLGIYLAKVFTEVKRRPTAIVRHITNQAHAQHDEHVRLAG